MSQRLHAALVALDKATRQSTDERTPLLRAKIRGLMRGYDARWGHVNLQVSGVEETISSDLWNPVTGKKSRSFLVTGKIDVRAADGSSQLLIDHKTTSEDITDPSSPYWRQLVVERQLSHYLLLEWLNGRKIDMAMWDVVRKPGISPKNVTKADRARVEIDGYYFGWNIDEASLLELRETERESLAMYEARVAHSCTIEKPEWYFQRRSIPRLDSELMEHAKELWEHGQELLHVRRENRHVRNSGACMLYGRPCKYLGVCSGHDDIDSGKWKRKTWVHNELPVIDGSDGKDLLTNSRVSSFLTCRRKHYYDYEIGLERVEDDEAESLMFGTLYHAAQEAWWKQIQKEQNNGDNTSSAPAIEAGTAADHVTC